MKYGRSLPDLGNELERQLLTKSDMIVPTQCMHCETDDGGQTRVLVEMSDGVKAYPTTEVFRRQVADKLKIPFAYFDRMRTEQPSLLDRNINTWLHAEPENRMVRTLDGQARAFLSDRYRRLDNYDLMQHIFPILQRLPGARFESVELTSTRMYLKVVSDAVTAEIQPGDVVQAGVVISHSEIGQGTLPIQPLVLRLVCRKGVIVADRVLRKTHVGRSVDVSAEEVTVFKDDTLAADDHAFFLRTRDVVEACVSEATLNALSAKLRRTLGIMLTGDPVKAV